MKKQLQSITAILWLTFVPGLLAQEEPFNCDFNAYLFQFNDVYALNLASGNSILVAENITEEKINATGYNPTDGYIWGSLAGSDKTIIRIGADFHVDQYSIPTLPTANRYIGDIDVNGIYHLKPSGTTVYRVDINPESPNYLNGLSNLTLSQNINIHDWAFNAVDGMLYTAEKGSNVLYRIDPATGLVTALGEIPIMAGLNYTYGAVYFDADGRFYISANQTGTIYVIQDVQSLEAGSNMASNLFAFGPASSSNDGARCPTAPVPQEDCTNGIDDDGDGLIDCDDPSCSGIAECPVVDPTSGASDGGLESNNRLSDAISQRNYNRVKSGFSFNPFEQPKLSSRVQLKAKSGSDGFELADFLPLGVLSGTVSVESTPADLITITNATEVIAIDILRDQQAVAAVLGMQSEGRVYEHTKYICDRLLGAELLNVSTILLGETPFIVSQIKNPDGTREFVISLTVVDSGDSSFNIESHWNLDRYSEGGTYYTYQLWANQLDDLFLLGEEFLRLVNTERPVENISVSNPPEVYVKKGTYSNGQLNLTLINRVGSMQANVEGGIRYSETADTESVNATIELAGNFEQEMDLNTGTLFDLGFRIEAEESTTPDDLFFSDGVWGIDQADPSLSLVNYEINAQETTDYEDGLYLERSLNLEATFNDYTAVYRSFNPRFKPVSLSNFNAFEFAASGSGAMQITLVQSNISDWTDQPRTSLELSETLENHTLSLSSFGRTSGIAVDLSKITSVVFTFLAEGSPRQLKVQLSDLAFKQVELPDPVKLDDSRFTIAPNPMTEASVMRWNNASGESQKVLIHDMLGQQILEKEINAQAGLNELSIGGLNLRSGIYIVSLVGQTQTRTLKLMVQ